MKYYEFNKTDYYALIAVKESKVDSMIKAMKLYVEYVGYDSVEEIRVNGLHPVELTKDQALLKFLLAGGNENVSVGTLKKDFDECEDNILLIDGSLI